LMPVKGIPFEEVVSRDGLVLTLVLSSGSRFLLIRNFPPAKTPRLAACGKRAIYLFVRNIGFAFLAVSENFPKSDYESAALTG
ncbi:MAG TPA: hypothetical protein VKX39_09710, partial [Bryobacteraceae bacterium]|nr:hypothetical protein [Bryobacteraceae bacterium]